jgi:hypothetical protein
VTGRTFFFFLLKLPIFSEISYSELCCRRSLQTANKVYSMKYLKLHIFEISLHTKKKLPVKIFNTHTWLLKKFVRVCYLPSRFQYCIIILHYIVIKYINGPWFTVCKILIRPIECGKYAKQLPNSTFVIVEGHICFSKIVDLIISLKIPRQFFVK